MSGLPLLLVQVTPLAAARALEHEPLRQREVFACDLPEPAELGVYEAHGLLVGENASG